VSELGRDAKLSTATAGRYLSLMEASYVLHRLAPHLGNRASRLIKSPKVYVSDAGLAAHLCGLAPDAPIGDDPLRGALFETYAAQNLAALLEARWPAARMGFWHVQGRYEVDFIVEAGRDTLAIEIKSSGRWSDRDTAGLRAFLDRSPRSRAAILAHNGAASVQLGQRLWAIPLATVLG
jgi:predicted AAA+ superfamily ATPase